MSQPTSLFLAPADPMSTPPVGTIRETLEQLAIIAAPLGPDTHAAGEGFGRHVIYAGCSPHLVMHPPADGSRRFCHVALHGPFNRPRLVTGPNTVKPRCPGCRSRYTGWRDRLAAWQAGTGQAPCDGCGRVNSPCDLDWRSHAICARLLVELRNVYPAEANPSDLLMHELERASGEVWRYAWAGQLSTVGETAEPA